MVIQSRFVSTLSSHPLATKSQLISIKMHRHCQESCGKEKTSGAKNRIESHQKRIWSEILAQRFPKPEYVYVHIFYSLLHGNFLAQISPLKAKRVHSVGLDADLSMMASQSNVEGFLVDW